jgi:hypothetical protein
MHHLEINRCATIGSMIWIMIKRFCLEQKVSFDLRNTTVLEGCKRMKIELSYLDLYKAQQKTSETVLDKEIMLPWWMLQAYSWFLCWNIRCQTKNILLIYVYRVPWKLSVYLYQTFTLENNLFECVVAKPGCRNSILAMTKVLVPDFISSAFQDWPKMIPSSAINCLKLRIDLSSVWNSWIEKVDCQSVVPPGRF